MLCGRNSEPLSVSTTAGDHVQLWRAGGRPMGGSSLAEADPAASTICVGSAPPDRASQSYCPNRAQLVWLEERWRDARRPALRVHGCPSRDGGLPPSTRTGRLSRVRDGQWSTNRILSERRSQPRPWPGQREFSFRYAPLSPLAVTRTFSRPRLD